MHVPTRDIALGLFVISVWAANTIAIKFVTFEVPPFTGLAIRLIIGSIIFAPFLRWPGRKKFWLIFQIIMLLAVIHWGSLIWSIDKLDASMASILMQTQVIFAAILGVIFFKEKIGWRTTSGIFIGIIGVAILVGLPQNPPAINGVLGMIFSMLAIAFAYARMKGLHDIAPTNYIAHMHILSSIPVLCLALIFEKPLDIQVSNINYTTLIPALIFQVLIVSTAHMIWQRLINRNAMSALPNLTLLIPIIGVVLAMLLLNETVTPTMIFGGLLTTAGVGIVMIRRQKKHLPID